MGEADKIYQRALALWGEDAQLGMVQEECAELIAEVSRFKRGRVDRAALASECADVMIMARQLRLIVGPDLVDDAVLRKNERLQRRIEEAERATAPSDFIYDVFRNGTPTVTVRVTHVPTGLVKSGEGLTAYAVREKILKELREELAEKD